MASGAGAGAGMGMNVDSGPDMLTMTSLKFGTGVYSILYSGVLQSESLLLGYTYIFGRELESSGLLLGHWRALRSCGCLLSLLENLWFASSLLCLLREF